MKVLCFGGHTEIEITQETCIVEDEDGQHWRVAPCASAPRVCPECRKEPKTMKAAREEMEKHFADESHVAVRRAKVEMGVAA
jgi:hypothetical protein